MLALPSGPQPAPKRQIFVGTAAACVAGTMLIGTMMATWLAFRAAAPNRAGDPDERLVIKDWLPASITVPETPTNMMLVGLAVACVMAQWAVYAGKRGIHTHTGMAIGMTFLMGLAVVNAQAFVWSKMGVPVASQYGALFYAATGAMTALMLTGLAYTVVAGFRYLGGRTSEIEVLSAHAMYWYFLTAAFTVVWFVIYVQK